MTDEVTNREGMTVAAKSVARHLNTVAARRLAIIGRNVCFRKGHLPAVIVEKR